MNNYLGTRANPMQALQQQFQALQTNPAQFLSRFNIPQNIMNDPNAILQHLLSTGAFTQEQINNAYQAFYNMKK